MLGRPAPHDDSAADWELRIGRCVEQYGGRHRSVAIAEEIAAYLRAGGVEVEHRHIDRPVLPH
ncbi:RapZ C-terminal domain-containing protein [Streptomyces shenzhenensis]|uniref:RapZ C-terminal domain-containing protein n=1 Tax=Streptomyces shenzhenensis TaxID=943815 RepID=UPI003558B5D3